MNPKCKIWWHLVIMGTLVFLALGGLYGLYWTSYCRAAETAVEAAWNTGEVRQSLKDIERRLESMEKKLDRNR